MKYIVEFYKGLDAVNLFIFWGVIGVVLLLLIFSIIMVNRNRKLEKIIEAEGIDIDDNDLAIKKYNEMDSNKEIIKQERNRMVERTTEKESIISKESIDDDIAIKEYHEEPINEAKIDYPTREKNVSENTDGIDFPKLENSFKKDDEIPIAKFERPNNENKFIAEEHVMEYNKDFFEIPTINKQSEIKEKEIQNSVSNEDKVTNRNISRQERTERINSATYQRNILRKMYPNQTSPIGIIKKETPETNNAKELNELLNNEQPSKSEKNVATHPIEKRDYVSNASKYEIKPENQRRGNYLEELSKKMSENNANNNVDRTSYEIQQEQDAIISYKELMQKKDYIKMIDEEDAVISIEELKNRKHEDEKIYNITEKEPNDDFIDELKNFRSDL